MCCEDPGRDIVLYRFPPEKDHRNGCAAEHRNERHVAHGSIDLGSTTAYLDLKET